MPALVGAHGVKGIFGLDTFSIRERFSTYNHSDDGDYHPRDPIHKHKMRITQDVRKENVVSEVKRQVAQGSQ